MRCWLMVFALFFAFGAGAQEQQAPQTARQALIEMFFGAGPDHVKKHLPDATRNAFRKLGSGNGMNLLDEFEMFASQARSGGTKIQTFDTGPNLVEAEDPQQNGNFTITVERDDLSGDEDQIEVALHMTKEAIEQTLPFVPHFTFSMKQEGDIWRLSEISVTVRLPLEDPEFLKNLEDRQRAQNEQLGIYAMHSIISAQTAVHSVRGSYACSLADLGKAAADAKTPMYALGPDVAAGKSGSYVFAISACDGNKYTAAAEPAMPDSGQRAFCADESGVLRGSADGKATTCLRNGTPVEAQITTAELAVATPNSSPAPAPSPSTPASGSASGSRPLPQRVRVSQGVSQSMILSKVQPVYPPEAKAARVQGSVVLGAIIGKDGAVQSLRVISSPSPLLEQAAMDAVKQWKYRPYLLNGNPVEVDTQITVNFVLAKR